MKPVYRSYAESFRIDFYLPESGLIAPPTATYQADNRLAEAMRSDRPPQSVLLDAAEGFTVLSPDGTAAGMLADLMCLIRGKAVPIVRFQDAAAGKEIVRFAKENCVGDLTLCVPYEKRTLLPVVRRELPLSRGMLDARGCSYDLQELVGQCHASDATMLLMDAGTPGSIIRALQKRFVQVWLAGDGSEAEALFAGACGVLTQNPGVLYDLIARFPENSTVRPTPLYAHKAWHVTGEYPENSTAACTAAGRLGYDAAEIDVQLTRDDVMVVHHDRDTKNLFAENCVVHETDWETLRSIRRKSFPEYGMDRMDGLMREMTDWPDTPVLIEIKTPANTFGVEEMVRQLKAVLAEDGVQKMCTCIMGVMPPYLSYVHEQMPDLPVAHCVGDRNGRPADTADGANLRIYALAQETRGANAGYNPYHPMIDGLFTRLAHMRGITVFPWSWAFEPWEDCREALTESYLQGHDGLTSDWVGKFYHVPVAVRAVCAERCRTGESLPVRAEKLTRGGKWEETEAEILLLDDGMEVADGGVKAANPGKRRFAVGCRTRLETGKEMIVYSPVCTVGFE